MKSELTDVWNDRTLRLLGYIQSAKAALEKLGYEEDDRFDDHGGNTVWLVEEKKFNLTGAFFVGVYMSQRAQKEISDFELSQLRIIFDQFFWAGATTTELEQQLSDNDFWDPNMIEEDWASHNAAAGSR